MRKGTACGIRYSGRRRLRVAVPLLRTGLRRIGSYLCEDRSCDRDLVGRAGPGLGRCLCHGSALADGSWWSQEAGAGKRPWTLLNAHLCDKLVAGSIEPQSCQFFSTSLATSAAECPFTRKPWPGCDGLPTPLRGSMGPPPRRTAVRTDL